jgi:hypothetical protein
MPNDCFFITNEARSWRDVRSVADPDPGPHHFGNLDPDTHQSGKLKVKSRIRVIQIRIKL